MLKEGFSAEATADRDLKYVPMKAEDGVEHAEKPCHTASIMCVCKTVRRSVWLKCGEMKDCSSWDAGHARPYMQIVFQVF